MERLKLSATKREQKGKGAVKRLRKEGLVPGVLYGLDRDPVNLKLDAKEMSKAIGGNAIIDLELDGDIQPVMVKDYQRDVIKLSLLHVDLYRINLDEKVVVEVAIELVGQAAGEREGGVLEQILRKIEIECLPTNIPESIEVDISELEIGQSISVDQLEVEDEIDILTDGDETVATVVVPTELDLEPTADAEEEVEEPEVIGEDPDEDEEVEAEDTEE